MDWSERRLYGILDLGYVAPADVACVASEMIAGGVDVIQLRAKGYGAAAISPLAKAVHEIAKARGVPFIVNDYPEIARQVGAEGVHVGQDDLSIAEAQALAGGGCIVGRSTHSVAQAQQALADGADYIGFGPLFATPTKPNYVPIGLHDIREVHATVPLPIFCIGGIKRHNLPEVLAAGGRRVVIVSELLQAPDIATYICSTRELLNQQS